MAGISGECDRGSFATSRRELAANGGKMFMDITTANEEAYQQQRCSQIADAAAGAASSTAIMTNNKLLERLIVEMSDMKSILRVETNAATSIPASIMQQHTTTSQPTTCLNDIEDILRSIDVVDERITRLESKKYDDSYKSYGNGPAVLNLSGAEKFLLAQLRETKRLLSSRLPTCV